MFRLRRGVNFSLGYIPSTPTMTIGIWTGRYPRHGSAEELKKMRINFFGPDRAYHGARQRFVYNGAPLPRA